jgi:short-subunit dehydrogenase
MRFAGKHIVLTGASSGIGEAAALRLAALGAHVCLVARRETELRRVRDAIAQAGGEAEIYPADLSDRDAVGALARRLLEEQPRIDVLINNAGRSIRRSVAESLDRFHDYTRTMQLNYFAPVQLTLALLPRFYEQGAGHIINVSSMAALIPTPRFSAYTASKCALDGFSRTLAAEHVDRGLAVTTINYPLVKTPMTAPTRIYRYLPQMDRSKAAEWMVEAIARRPVRMTTYAGRTWGTATAALPGPSVRATGRLFRTVGEVLRRRAERDSRD